MTASLAGLTFEVAFPLAANELIHQELREVPASSVKRALFLCSRCGSTKDQIMVQRGKHGCPQCSQKNVYSKDFKAGINDLATLVPESIDYWDFRKNLFRPKDVKAKSKSKAWLYCRTCGISSLRNIYNFFFSPRPAKCDYCHFRKLFRGVNDLRTVAPDMAEIFDVAKNGAKAESTIASSDKSFFLTCSKGHVKKANLKSFRVHGIDCGKCSTQSKLEKEVQEFIEGLDIEIVLHDRTILSGKEIDLFLLQHKIGIEVNGDYWHGPNSPKVLNPLGSSLLKAKLASDEGITLLTVWERDWRERRDEIKQALEIAILSKEVPAILSYFPYIDLDAKTSQEIIENICRSFRAKPSSPEELEGLFREAAARKKVN